MLDRSWFGYALAVCVQLVSLCIVCAGGVATVRAQIVEEDRLTTKFPINDGDPESSVPTPAEAMRMPLQMGYHIMLLSERAEAATQRGDHAAAARFWRALAKAAPDRSKAYAQLCKSYQAAGDFDKAIESCRTALGKAGTTVEDSLGFVSLMLSKQAELTASEVADVEAVAQHLEEQLKGEKGGVIASRLRCQLGARLSDVKRLQACTTRLQQLAPSDSQTLVFTWTLSMLEKNYSAAGATLQKAEKLKLAPAALDKMRASLLQQRERDSHSWQRVLMQPLVLIVVASILAFVALTALRTNRRGA